MKYKLIKKANPINRKEVNLYAYPINAGKITIKSLATSISGSSSVAHGDVLSVLQSLCDKLPSMLKSGFSVQLGDFCTLRLTLNSKGMLTAEEFNTNTIKPRVVIVVGKDMKHNLSDNRYERIH